ncbi:MAG: hypothetical protein JL50_17355 [Peptococcaceae bacterium BICA1-7]|nr:MAG: hypothetical protein JL50_17355 [Peptococcaceae bacterium BICA1-7]HBV98683.1 hypothetical protein [Desulfotomaculum sp.]
MPNSNRIAELQQELLALRISDWHEKVFSFQWFFIIFLLIVPWVIWWKLVNRKYIAEILSFGLLTAITASILNEIFLNLQFWRAPYSLAPVPPRWFAPAYSLLPVTFMLIYQYFQTWRSFTIATIVIAGISAFAFQPILSWMGIMILIKWNYFYSFLTFIAAGLGVRLLHQAIIQTETTIENVKTIAEIKNQPGLSSPALKRMISKIKGD